MHSPSGLATLELCERKYAWDKVDKIPRESNPYAVFGITTHKRIEDYYLHGVMPDLAEPEGNAAAALLAHLPPPQPGLRVEEHRIVGRFHGYPDLTLGNRVWDHKTTSDHKWAKSADVLPHDLQAALYASFVMAEESVGKVVLQWNYVTRSKPRVLPIVREVYLVDIAPTLDRAERLADRADTILANHTPALALPPNVSACDLFGGCVHRLRCNLSPGDIMASHLAKYDTLEPDPYHVARAEAQRNANETGCDFGIEKNPLFGTYRVFGLPMQKNRQGHELRCEVVSCEHLSKCQPGHGPHTRHGLWPLQPGSNMTTASDFQNAMNNAHPPAPGAPPPPPPAGNPWDGLPSTHVNETMWYNAAVSAWVPKVAAPPPPPAPPVVTVASPVTAIPINPPVTAIPINPPPPAPPPPAPEAAPAKRGPGRPKKAEATPPASVVVSDGPGGPNVLPPSVSAPVLATHASGPAALADVLEAAARYLRTLG